MAQDGAPAAIQARNLSVHYGATEALKPTTLDIPAKAVTAIIGPSGCGKSTFLRSLNRMNDTVPGARIGGEVLVGGKNIYDPSMDVVALRTRVGMVFQKPNPFPKSIRDNVLFGPRLHRKLSADEADAILEKSLRRAALWDEVKDRLNQSALGLSGGQQQRLCIARALAVEPEVLLLDEPASALDPIATAKIEDLLEELKQSLTLVIVTHNMQQAARVSDQTAFFYMGSLVEMGPTRDVFENPREKQTEDYVTGRFG